MRTTGVFLAAAVLAALVSSAAIAGAAPAPLALKRIVATRQAGRFTLRIELNQRWRNTALQGGTEVRVLYDSTGDGKTDYTGRIAARNGDLYESISGRNRYEPVPVYRPSQTMARFTHPVDTMFANRSKPGTLRIAVVVDDAGKIDRLPRQGWFEVPPPPHRTVER